MRADRRIAWSRAAAALAVAIASGCGGSGAPVRVVIPPGASMRTAADSLARTGVVGSARLFRFYASLRGSDRGIKAGTYLLHRHSSWSEVVDALRGGKGLVHVVTIPEGFALSQISATLVAKLGVAAESIDVAARDTSELNRLRVPTSTLEGYLFPDTYLFPEGTTARGAVEAMVRRFEQVWRPEWTARLDSVPLDRHGIMTLASLVEKEARLAEERPVIAAVYLNRLRDKMLLQADPTVQYALGKHVQRVFYRDLEVESAYNTYRHTGLPPGPIASPGRASIEAALYPANVPYEYFVALPDGHHEFRRDLTSHMRAKLDARKAWDSLEALRPPSSTPTKRDGAARP